MISSRYQNEDLLLDNIITLPYCSRTYFLELNRTSAPPQALLEKRHVLFSLVIYLACYISDPNPDKLLVYCFDFW